MSTVALIPPDDLDVVGLGSVKAGVPVDVPIELAGVAPDPQREVQMQALAAAIAAHDHAAAQVCREAIIGTVEVPALEMGRGLLAQGWELATPAPHATPSPVTEVSAAEKKALKKAAEDAAAAAVANTDTKEG